MWLCCSACACGWTVHPASLHFVNSELVQNQLKDDLISARFGRHPNLGCILKDVCICICCTNCIYNFVFFSWDCLTLRCKLWKKIKSCNFSSSCKPDFLLGLLVWLAVWKKLCRPPVALVEEWSVWNSQEPLVKYKVIHQICIWYF